MLRYTLFILAASAAVTGAAAAQSSSRTIDLVTAARLQPQEATVRVQNSISLFLAGPTGTEESAEKLRERARQMIYATAARECDLLKQALASECRLESVNSNVNGNRPSSPTQQEGINVNGSMTFRIKPK